MPSGRLCGRWLSGSRTVPGEQCGGSVECRSVWALVTNVLEGGTLVGVYPASCSPLLDSSIWEVEGNVSRKGPRFERCSDRSPADVVDSSCKVCQTLKGNPTGSEGYPLRSLGSTTVFRRVLTSPCSLNHLHLSAESYRFVAVAD